MTVTVEPTTDPRFPIGRVPVPRKKTPQGSLLSPLKPRVNGEGYSVVQWPGHPLATNGSVREHRAVLFDKIGPGMHSCHWCAKPVTWGGRGASPGRSAPSDTCREGRGLDAVA